MFSPKNIVFSVCCSSSILKIFLEKKIEIFSKKLIFGQMLKNYDKNVRMLG